MRRLADARRPDQRGDLAAWRSRRSRSLQDGPLAVGERDAVEADRRARRRRRSRGRCQTSWASSLTCSSRHQRAVLVVGLDEPLRQPLHRHQGGDRLDHQDRHDQEVVDLELQPGDGEVDADGQHGADHRLLQVGGELGAERSRRATSSASSRASSSNTVGEPVGTPHGPDRLDADQRVGELGRALADLLPVLLGLLPRRAGRARRTRARSAR